MKFYDDEKDLIEVVAGFAIDGLRRGHAAILIVSPGHAEALRARVAAAGFDPRALAAEDRYVEIDVENALATVAGDGLPDPAAFERTIGQPALAAIERFGDAVVFGEMAVRLCLSGRVEAALQLERLWLDLCTRVRIHLLRAYPIDAFLHGDGERLLEEVCSIDAGGPFPGDDSPAMPDAAHRPGAEAPWRHARALEREVALRRALQKRLAQRDHELNDFLENGAEPLHKLDAEGTILWANRAELALLGYADHEYVGHDIREFHVDPEKAVACLGAVVGGGAVHNEPARLRHKDGSIRHVLISSNAFRIDGLFVHARCFSRDVTAHVRAEERLREELDAWEVLRRTGVALNSELDLERLMQTVVDAAVELTRARWGVLLYREEDEPGVSSWLRTAAGPPHETPTGFPLALGSGILSPTLRGEGLVRRDDLRRDPLFDAASWRDLPVGSYLAAPLTSRSGQIHGGLFLAHPDAALFTRRDELVIEGIVAQAAIAIDNARLFRANERSRTEQNTFNETLERRIVERTEALHRSERQLDQLLSGIADYAIFLLDAEGCVLTWNTGAERIVGYTAAEIVGRSFACFHTPEERAAGLPERALAIARAEGKYEAEAWRVRKDGSRFWASVLLDAIHDRNGEIVGFAKVTRDMTEQHAIEEQLRQAQRMEAVGRMTGGIAHDFNNLLTIILGNLDAVCRETGLTQKVRTAAEHAMKGAQRATVLIQQLLAFSRRQSLNPKPTDINRLVAGTAELLKRTFGESIAIVTELADEPAICEVDAVQLESALINLAMNARDAMPAGGRLTLSTSSVGPDTSDAEQARDCVVIGVTDTGIGMSADVREHAFEPFFTTKPTGRGTGLGLSQVYGFVKQSGGQVKIHSESGRGTTIAIHLPCLHAEIPETVEVGPTETPDGSGTILLVEDDEDVRRYGAGMLRELGFGVLEAADGEAALALLERHPQVRLLFTDVGLPGIDGMQLAKQARRAQPDLKVLFTTGYAYHSLASSVRVEEGDALLRKPYTRAQLARSIRGLLDGDVEAERPRALLLEDDALLRHLTARMLERMGFDVTQADSVATALELVGSHRFDFALIDRLLGDGDGIVVARALRAAHPPTPMLLTSGYGDPEPEDTGDGDVLAETLRKPYGYDALADAIAQLGVHTRHLNPDRP